MIPGMMPMAPQGGAPDQEAFATGVLAGAGLRELSQTLGLSRKRGQGASGAQPPAAQLAAGNLGDVDKLMLLSKLQGMFGGAPAPGMAPGPMGVNPLAMGGMRPPLPMGAPGMPMAGPAPMGAPGMPRPMMPGAMPAPAPMGPGPMGAPMAPGPSANPGGSLPMQLLTQLLSGARGVV